MKIQTGENATNGQNAAPVAYLTISDVPSRSLVNHFGIDNPCPKNKAVTIWSEHPRNVVKPQHENWKDEKVQKRLTGKKEEGP